MYQIFMKDSYDDDWSTTINKTKVIAKFGNKEDAISCAEVIKAAYPTYIFGVAEIDNKGKVVRYLPETV